jgi:hypothetical protein
MPKRAVKSLFIKKKKERKNKERKNNLCKIVVVAGVGVGVLLST